MIDYELLAAINLTQDLSSKTIRVTLIRRECRDFERGFLSYLGGRIVQPTFDEIASSQPDRSLKLRARSMDIEKQSVGALSVGAQSLGALAVGAVAFGAAAIGALAIGSLAIGRLVIRKSHLRSLEIDELKVKRLTVEELNVNSQEVAD